MSRYTTVKRGAPKQTEVRQSARYPEDVAAGARLGWLGALGVGRVAILRDNTFTFTRTHVNDEPWLLIRTISSVVVHRMPLFGSTPELQRSLLES